MVERYWWLCPMRELILDHGAGIIKTLIFNRNYLAKDN
jgi:hypothetical protein